MFYSKKPFVLAAIVGAVLFFSRVPSSAKSSDARIETENFILYFESVNDDAYQDRDKIAQTAEAVYKDVSERLDMKRVEKIPVYFVRALYEDRLHGHAEVSMTKGGDTGVYIWYFPLSAWRSDDEFGFIKPLIPDVGRYFEKCMEEEIIKAFFVRKYLEPQKEPRKFNTYLYEFAAALTSFYSHFGISWLLNNPAVDETLPVSGILANKFNDVRALDKAISFCGFLSENYGFGAFERLLKTADYENVNLLLREIYKKDTESLEKEWRAWLKKKYGEDPRFFNEDEYRKRYDDVSQLYLFALRIASIPRRDYFLASAAAYQALLRIGCSDEKKFAAAKKLAEKRWAGVAAKERFCRVDFYFTEKAAETVSLGGDFNKWNHAAPFNHLKLIDREKGLWHTTVNLPPGRYQYKFVVNGSRWISDENADGLAPDGFGGQNSVLVIEEGVRKKIAGAM